MTEVNIRLYLRAAVKAKSPIIGIPRLCARPVCFEQRRLKNALKGVLVLDARLVFMGDAYFLAVAGKVGLVHTRFRMREVHWREAAIRIRKWADTQRVKPVKNTKLALRIERLQAEVSRYHRDAHRALWPRPAVYDGVGNRTAILCWYKQRPMRRKFKSKAELPWGKGIMLRKPYELRDVTASLQPGKRFEFLKSVDYLVLREELRGLQSLGKL